MIRLTALQCNAVEQSNTSFDFSGTFLGIHATRPSYFPKHLEFSGLQMKTIFKAFFLLIALSAVPVLAQSDFEATKALAEAGDAQAQYDLGVMYEVGIGIAANIQEAVRWYRLAAEQGLYIAQGTLGVKYFTGTGVAENDQEAVNWYRLAAVQGDPAAQRNLGVMYEYGRGGAQNYAKAYMWYSVSAAQGNLLAAEQMSRITPLLSPQALEQAQAQATRCFESNFKDCD
jgi:TPR repeat protein